MSRASLALAPTMLLAAGGFATAAVAGPTVYTDTFGDGLTIDDNQDVAIGMDLLGSPYGVAQYHYGLKTGPEGTTPSLTTIGPNSFIGIGSGINGPLDGEIYTTPDLPDPTENFSSGVTKPSIPAIATLDGTVIASDDAYVHLRFDIEGVAYLGSAHFDASDHTTNGVKLMDVRYTAAPTPEPATWAEMIGGLGAIGGAMRLARRRKTQLASA